MSGPMRSASVATNRAAPTRVLSPTPRFAMFPKRVTSASANEECVF